MNLSQLEAESSIDREAIRGPATRQMPQLIGGNGAATAAASPIEPLGTAVLTTTYERQHSLVARAAKRAFDLVGALLLVALLAPAWLVIALLISADSPGPTLFRQRRIGRDGQPFWMLKFRTMVDGADFYKPALLHLNGAADGLFKINGDPRVTRTGAWLRATCLDELPQLLNVITGKMSLVGPRPLVPEEDATIRGSQRRRLQMRPGMTGVWQVAGASAIPISTMVELDSDYVESWSLWSDVKLIAGTASLVLLRKGL